MSLFGNLDPKAKQVLFFWDKQVTIVITNYGSILTVLPQPPTLATL